MPFAQISRFLRSVAVTLPADMSDELQLLKLRETLKEHPGESLVYLKLTRKDGSVEVLRAREYKVALETELVSTLTRVFGEAAVELRGSLTPPEASSNWRSRRSAGRANGR